MLNIPDNIYNWIPDFLGGHTHCTKFHNQVSANAEINASVIQGSALGPAAYLINASDLRPLDKQNEMAKFADDTYLIIAAERAQTCADEISNVEAWAIKNNLRLNTNKSLEIVFTAKSIRARSTEVGS